MCWQLNIITWQTISALATLAAVSLALVPIFRDWKRANSHAVSLRNRLSSNLFVIRPSLGNIINPIHKDHPTVLSVEEFRGIVRSISEMMKESYVLNPKEQAVLAKVYINLEVGARLYGTQEFKASTAKYILDAIEAALQLMDKGLQHKPIE